MVEVRVVDMPPRFKIAGTGQRLGHKGLLALHDKANVHQTMLANLERAGWRTPFVMMKPQFKVIGLRAAVTPGSSSIQEGPSIRTV